MEVDQERSHRVEQAIAVRPWPEREAHQETAILDRIREVLGHEDRGVAIDRVGQADRRHRRQPGDLEVSEYVELRRGDAARLLLERVGVAVEDEEADEVAGRPDRQVPEAEGRRRPLRERQLPRQLEQPRATLAQPQPREPGGMRSGGQSFLRR